MAIQKHKIKYWHLWWLRAIKIIGTNTYQRHVVVETTDHPWVERKHSIFKTHLKKWAKDINKLKDRGSNTIIQISFYIDFMYIYSATTRNEPVWRKLILIKNCLDFTKGPHFVGVYCLHASMQLVSLRKRSPSFVLN